MYVLTELKASFLLNAFAVLVGFPSDCCSQSFLTQRICCSQKLSLLNSCAVFLGVTSLWGFLSLL